MWEPLEIFSSSIPQKKVHALLKGKIPAIIFRNYFKKTFCNKICNKIENQKLGNFQNGKLKHLGPFLMAFPTKKDTYFEEAKRSLPFQTAIFEGTENPIKKIFKIMEESFPGHKVSIANEAENQYSPYVIRIHEEGKSIPLHKDKISYEGKNYEISKLNHQLSCVLHLQESDHGGNLIVYNHSWNQKDEKFRNIDFGYSSKLLGNSESCKMRLNQGDLVFLNPSFYHEVTKIIGRKSRITLGMFLGIYPQEGKIVAWA